MDRTGLGLTNFQVEFTVLPDPIPKTNQRGRCHATRIVHLKPTKNERSKGKYCSLATSFKVSTGQSRDVILERKPDFEVNTERVVNSQNPEFENSEPICGSIGK